MVSMINFIRNLWAPLVSSVGCYFFLLFAQPPNESPECAYFFLLPAIWWFSHKPKLRIVMLSFLLAGFLYHISLVGWIRHVTMGGMLGACLLLSIYQLPWFFLARILIPYSLERGFKARFITIVSLSCTWVTIEWLRCQFTLGFPGVHYRLRSGRGRFFFKPLNGSVVGLSPFFWFFLIYAWGLMCITS